MPSQTVDFLVKTSAALAGLYVTLVSNVDGVTAYQATLPSSDFGKWTINPKPPAGTYSLYTGAAQGALSTLVDPDFVVDPFNDDGTAVFPQKVMLGNGLDVSAAGQLQIGPTGGLATSAAIRSPQKALIVGKTLTSFGAGIQTLTAAILLGGVVEGTPTAGANYTLSNGTLLDAAVPNVANGDTFQCLVVNLAAGAFAITIVTAAGITLRGSTTTIAQNRMAILTFRRTGVATWTCYILVSA